MAQHPHSQNAERLSWCLMMTQREGLLRKPTPRKCRTSSSGFVQEEPGLAQAGGHLHFLPSLWVMSTFSVGCLTPTEASRGPLFLALLCWMTAPQWLLQHSLRHCWAPEPPLSDSTSCFFCVSLFLHAQSSPRSLQ